MKTASRALVSRLGGAEAAALVCRYQKSALAEGYDLHRPDRSLPIDVVADLERAAGAPVVTRVLAGLAGHALVPLPHGQAPEAQAIAQVLAGAAGLAADFAAAMCDGRFTEAERQVLRGRLLELHGAVAHAAAAVDAARTGNAA
jgi:hypothetical protein